MVKTQKIILKEPFQGLPRVDNFEVVEEELPPLKDGEFLTKGLCWSVDPYLRFYAPSVGNTMTGTQVAEIIESKSPKFPVGEYVLGDLGWTTYAISKDDVPQTSWSKTHLVPFTKEEAPLSLALGILGMPGNTAYFGLREVCLVKAGETVAVTAAAGAVGSTVGQIAKIMNCSVIGLAGSDEKCDWLKSIGFDHAINYKTADVKKALAEAAPKGIDCYFDNVGGELSSIIMEKMAFRGRVAICGAITFYNRDDLPKATMVQRSILSKLLTLKAFYVDEFFVREAEGIQQNLKWFKEGKLKYREHVTEGFESLPKALIGILTGENIGKAVVKPIGVKE